MSLPDKPNLDALLRTRFQLNAAEEEIAKAAERIKNATANLKKVCWHPEGAREQHNRVFTWEPPGSHGMSERSEIMCDEVCSICGKKLSTNPLKPTTKETPNK